MIRLTNNLTNNLWIGNSADGVNVGSLNTNVSVLRIGAMLNVAQDLRVMGGWPNIDYMQVGLIDGPGNPSFAYVSAVLALATLLQRHNTLVCCHTGSRSMAVALIYLNTRSNRGWDGWLELLSEREDIDMPLPNDAHKSAFNKMNWRLLTTVLED